MSPLRGLGYVYAIFFYRDVTPTGFGFVYDYRSTEMSPPTGLVSFPETWFYRDVTPTGQGYVYDYRSTEMLPLRGKDMYMLHFFVDFCLLLLVFI